MAALDLINIPYLKGGIDLQLFKNNRVFFEYGYALPIDMYSGKTLKFEYRRIISPVEDGIYFGLRYYTKNENIRIIHLIEDSTEHYKLRYDIHRKVYSYMAKIGYYHESFRHPRRIGYDMSFGLGYRRKEYQFSGITNYQLENRFMGDGFIEQMLYDGKHVSTIDLDLSIRIIFWLF